MGMSNERRQSIAKALRNELSMTSKEIGAYLGLHHTSVNHLIKNGTTGSNRGSTNNDEGGRGKARWNKNNTVIAGRTFIRLYSRPPTAGDWKAATVRSIYPSPTTITELWGSWADFMLELGYFAQRGHKPVKIV